MARERQLKVVILGDASSAQLAFGKLDAAAVKSGATVEKAQGRLAKFGPAITAGAAVGGAALLKLGGDAIKAASEGRKVEAQTRAVIASTGGAANVSARHVADLAEELKGVAKIDDEVIAAGENILLTFTNIRNQGAGKQIFDEATKAALDMSVAMKTDVTSAALVVGKAVNDPIAGLGALSRVGVQFTPQKEQLIRDLVAVGDTVGAQQQIISELNTQFGGSAKAAGDAATVIERLQLKLGDLQEKLGGGLIDLIERFEEGWGDLTTGLEVIANWEAKGNLREFLDGVGAVLDAIEASANAAFKAVKRLTDLPGEVVETGLKVVKSGSAPARAAKAAVKAIPGPLGDLIRSIPGFHAGGPVTAHHDEVPAVLQRGEYVIRRQVVREVGVPVLDQLNRWPRRPPRPRPRGFRFVPDVKLDTSQVQDRRGWQPPERRRVSDRYLHDGGVVGGPAATGRYADWPIAAVPSAGALPPAKVDRAALVADLTTAFTAALAALPATQSRHVENHFGPIHGLTLEQVEREADRRARLAALGGE